MESDLKVQLSRPNCAYCKAPVEIGETKRACEACMSWSHLECVELHGGCPACGAGQPAPAALDAGAKGSSAPDVAPQAVQPAEAEAPAPLEVRPGPPKTKLGDLVLLLVLGLAFFALSIPVLAALIRSVGELLGFFTSPGSRGNIGGYAALASLLTTFLFTIYCAVQIETYRTLTRASAGPEGIEPEGVNA